MPHASTYEDQVARKMRLDKMVSPYIDIVEAHTPLIEELPSEDQSILARGDSEVIISYFGTLKVDAETAYDALDNDLKSLDLYPIFRLRDDPKTPHQIHIADYRPIKPPALRIWPNIALFIATILSVLFTGATIAIGEIGLEDPARAAAMGETTLSILGELWRGWPYALSIMLILVPHEMGHFLTARRYNAAASWPYFLPAPIISPFGTFGAAIMLRESLKNRKWLLDMGASGPIAGFVIAVPLLIIGYATSPLQPMATEGMLEGNSILTIMAKLLVFGRILPDGTEDVLLNQVAWAGWTGLFVTALNLIPLGQLDGGHVLYALFGEKARLLYRPLLGLSIFMVLFVSEVWLLFAVMLVFVGRYYAVPLDTITPLNPARRRIGVAALVIFVLSIPPIPLRQIGNPTGLVPGLIVAVGLVTFWTLRRRGTVRPT